MTSSLPFRTRESGPSPTWASGAAERLAEAVTAWLSGDPSHGLETHLEKVELELEAVAERPEREMLETAVTLLRQAYSTDRASESWHLADMVRQVAGMLSLPVAA